MSILCKQSRTDHRRGFTLVELLMAMAITLLLMAALGKAFAVIGRTMKEGRSKVTISAKLRGLSFRVRSDLRLRTVIAKPPICEGDGQGYFLYYEGPMTEHTAALFGDEAYRVTSGDDEIGSSNPSFAGTDSPTYYRHSRMGDIDDYIAFTAEAPADGWFTGKVPAYMVEDNPPDLMAPRIIRSKYAEIIMWTSPKWQVDLTTNDLNYAPPPSGMPLFVDEDNDLLPDSVTLHQRILLIRPDLNTPGTITGSASGPDFDSDYLRPIAGTGGPENVPAALQRVYPISNPTLPVASRYFPTYVDPSSLGPAPATLFVSNWLVGMTPVHQFFDISLRRIVNPVTGEPSEFVAANSLEDLTEPHNRFGHVRFPGRYFGLGSPGTDSATSMPLLALAWNDALLRRAAPPTWFPAGYPSPTTLTGSNRTSLFNGWLLPHFALGDPSPPSTDADHWQRHYLLNPDSRWDRTGEDIMGANIHAFDLKGYDANAPVFLTSGLDGAPGRIAIDDDATTDIDLNYLDPPSGAFPKQLRSELGAVGSDDVVVRVGDIAINPLMNQLITDPRDADAYFAGTIAPFNGGRENQMLASTGDFVDLFYPYLAGGPMLDLYRQVGPFPTTPPLTPPLIPLQPATSNFLNFLQSNLSGWPLSPTTLTAMKSSGKLFHTSAVGNFAYMQPCFDTWTDRYESDGFDQTASGTGELTGTNGTVWVLYNPTGGYPGRVPRMSPAVPSPFTIDTGQYDPSRPESLAPIATELPAISVTIRIADPAADEISQVTVVEDLLN